MSWFKCHPAAPRVHKLQPSGLYAMCGASSCSSTRHFRVTEEELMKAYDAGQICPRCIEEMNKMKLTSNTWPLTHKEMMLDVARSHGKEQGKVEKLRRVDILGRDGLWRAAQFADIKKGMVFRLFDDNLSEFHEHGVPNVAAEDAYAMEGINWGCKCDEVPAFGAAPSSAPLTDADEDDDIEEEEDENE